MKKKAKKASRSKPSKKAIHASKIPTFSKIHSGTRDNKESPLEQKIPTEANESAPGEEAPQKNPEKDPSTNPSSQGQSFPELSVLEPSLRATLKRTAKVERIRHLLALDVRSVIRRLDVQLPAMIELFSRHRDRETLLSPLRAWVLTANFDHLTELEPEEQRALGEFLEELEALRWYCRYTDDMPHTAQSKLLHFTEQLDGAAQKLLREVESRMIIGTKHHPKRREKTSKTNL